MVRIWEDLLLNQYLTNIEWGDIMSISITGYLDKTSYVIWEGKRSNDYSSGYKFIMQSLPEIKPVIPKYSYKTVLGNKTEYKKVGKEYSQLEITAKLAWLFTDSEQEKRTVKQYQLHRYINDFLYGNSATYNNPNKGKLAFSNDVSYYYEADIQSVDIDVETNDLYAFATITWIAQPCIYRFFEIQSGQTDYTTASYYKVKGNNTLTISSAFTQDEVCQFTPITGVIADKADSILQIKISRTLLQNFLDAHTEPWTVFDFLTLGSLNIEDIPITDLDNLGDDTKVYCYRIKIYWTKVKALLDNLYDKNYGNYYVLEYNIGTMRSSIHQAVDYTLNNVTDGVFYNTSLANLSGCMDEYLPKYLTKGANSASYVRTIETTSNVWEFMQSNSLFTVKWQSSTNDTTNTFASWAVKRRLRGNLS